MSSWPGLPPRTPDSVLRAGSQTVDQGPTGIMHTHLWQQPRPRLAGRLPFLLPDSGSSHSGPHKSPQSWDRALLPAMCPLVWGQGQLPLLVVSATVEGAFWEALPNSVQVPALPPALPCPPPHHPGCPILSTT